MTYDWSTSSNDELIGRVERTIEDAQRMHLIPPHRHRIDEPALNEILAYRGRKIDV